MQPTRKKILFLPDGVLKYDYSREYYRVENICRPLSNNPLILDLIEVKKEIFACDKKYSFRDIPRFAEAEYEALKQKQVYLFLQLTQSQRKPTNTRAGRNAPCPCGSGLKLKKCCGK